MGRAMSRLSILIVSRRPDVSWLGIAFRAAFLRSSEFLDLTGACVVQRVVQITITKSVS